jgi:hypothetical protein
MNKWTSGFFTSGFFYRFFFPVNIKIDGRKIPRITNVSSNIPNAIVNPNKKSSCNNKRKQHMPWEDRKK